MRMTVTLVKEADNFTLRLLPAQRAAIVTAAMTVGELKVSELAIEVRFGSSRDALTSLASRLAEADSAVVTTWDLHAIYQLLRVLPDSFSSEEDFYTRTGYFTENFVGLSRALLDAVARPSN